MPTIDTATALAEHRETLIKIEEELPRLLLASDTAAKERDAIREQIEGSGTLALDDPRAFANLNKKLAEAEARRQQADLAVTALTREKGLRQQHVTTYEAKAHEEDAFVALAELQALAPEIDSQAARLAALLQRAAKVTGDIDEHWTRAGHRHRELADPDTLGALLRHLGHTVGLDLNKIGWTIPSLADDLHTRRLTHDTTYQREGTTP